MKHAIAYIFIFFAFSSFVFAQEVINENTLILPQKREEIKKHIEEKQIELQSQIQEKREEVKEQIETQNAEEKTPLQILAQERVLKVVTLIFEKFEAVLVKFDGIILRIETRTAKLNEQGISTLEQETLLAQAQKSFGESLALISATKLELQDSITTKETTIEDIKTRIDVCKTSLKQTQSLLIEVVESLKKIENSEENLLVE